MNLIYIVSSKPPEYVVRLLSKTGRDGLCVEMRNSWPSEQPCRGQLQARMVVVPSRAPQ